MSISIKLAEYIASHICHDLANSIGAADNSIDYVLDLSNIVKEDLETAKLASRSSVSRICFLRQLYAYSPAEMRLSELINLIQQRFTSDKITFAFEANTVDKKIKLPDILSKLLCAFSYISHKNIPRGGELSIDVKYHAKDDLFEFCVSSSGQNLLIKQVLAEVLDSKARQVDISHENVVAYYLLQLIDQNNINYRIDKGSQTLAYTFTSKITAQLYA